MDRRGWLSIFILLIIIVLFLTVIVLLIAPNSLKKLRLQPLIETPRTIQIPESSIVKSITVVTTEGGRLDWSPDGKLIAFDRIGQDKFFDVWTMNPDGSNQTCVTCKNTAIPGKHMGMPAWHPNSDLIILAAEKKEHPGRSLQAVPGLSYENDLWVTTTDGQKAWQLTNLPFGRGVLHPMFSRDGKKLLWAEMLRKPSVKDALPVWRDGGTYVMRLADFVYDGKTASLTNIKDLQPNGEVVYETHGFSPDDKKILFSSLKPGQEVWTWDIYSMELETGALSNLTDDPNNWDEHAHFSPSGKKVIWISSKDCGCNPKNNLSLQSDLWLMNSNGSGKVRLTHFHDKNFSEYLGEKAVTADNAWSPDGKRLAVVVLVLPGSKAYIAVLEFKEPQ